MMDFSIARRAREFCITRTTRRRPGRRPIPLPPQPPERIRPLRPPVKDNHKAREMSVCGSDLEVRHFKNFATWPSGPDPSGAEAHPGARWNVGAKAPTHKTWELPQASSAV